MLYLNLLAIQLFPHYAMVAALVIAAHWIWIFGIRKNKLQKKDILKGGYQTGGSTKHSFPKLNTLQEESLIPKPSLPQEFVVNNKISIAPCVAEVPLPQESEALQLNSENLNYLSYELTENQAELNISSALVKLSEGKISANELKTLNDIAAITVAADEHYPQALEVVQEILNSDTENFKGLPFIL